jgi:predicted ATP-grasp superfamily ATP-dependent carboligase
VSPGEFINVKADLILANDITAPIAIKEFQRIGVKRVFTLAAYITGQFTQSPKVFATSTEPTFLQELMKEDVKLMNEGSITGMNGIVIDDIIENFLIVVFIR